MEVEGLTIITLFLSCGPHKPRSLRLELGAGVEKSTTCWGRPHLTHMGGNDAVKVTEPSTNSKPPFSWWFPNLQLWPQADLVGVTGNKNSFQLLNAWRMLQIPTADEKRVIYTSLQIALYHSWRKKIYNTVCSQKFQVNPPISEGGDHSDFTAIGLQKPDSENSKTSAAPAEIKGTEDSLQYWKNNHSSFPTTVLFLSLWL